MDLNLIIILSLRTLFCQFIENSGLLFRVHCVYCAWSVVLLCSGKIVAIGTSFTVYLNPVVTLPCMFFDY
mgnify:CR=1 FL=1